MDSEYVKMRRAECSGAMERLRREILEFLAVDDRNGRYTDAQCEAEGADPLSFEDAVELLSDAYRERMVPATCPHGHPVDGPCVTCNI